MNFYKIFITTLESGIDQIENDWEFDEETQLRIVEECYITKNNYLPIKFIRNPIKKVYLEAIKKNGYAINYIENPTEEMKLEAVKQNGFAIQYIKDPTEEMCLEAIRKNKLIINYIVNPTERIYIEAVKQNGSSIYYILKKNQSFDIIKAFFDFDWNKSKYSREDYYKYLAKKFITKDQALIMIQDDTENINLVSRKIKRELLEMKPELEKYLKKE